MGVNLTPLLPRSTLNPETLKNHICVVDGYNILYQFLSTIRQSDGTPLKNSKGEVTSHLVGLFSRTTKLMQEGVKLAFVFDGEPPPLKKQTLQQRKARKAEAQEAYEEAKEEGDIGSMRKYAMQTTKLTKAMVDEAKQVCTGLGLPVIQAPSEGEAQMAHMIKQGDGWAGVSQDYDSLLYGCSRLIRNLSLQGKRKIPGSPRYRSINPELLELRHVLDDLSVTQDQLIALSMLIGTDYNPKGIKGIGPKKGLKKVRAYDDPAELFEDIQFNDQSDVTWQAIWETFKTMPVTDDYTLTWRQIDGDVLQQFLVEEKEFSSKRVQQSLQALDATKNTREQTSLGAFS